MRIIPNLCTHEKPQLRQRHGVEVRERSVPPAGDLDLVYTCTGFLRQHTQTLLTHVRRELVSIRRLDLRKVILLSRWQDKESLRYEVECTRKRGRWYRL